MIRFLNYLVVPLTATYLLKLQLFSGATLNVLDLILLTVIVLNGYYISIEGWWKDFFKLKPLLLVAIALILVGFYMSLVINSTKNSLLDSLGILKSFLVLPILFAWTFSFLITKRVLVWRKFFAAYLFMSSALSLLALFFFFTQNYTFDGRVQLFFNSPNYLAMLLTPAIPILLLLINEARAKLKGFLLLLLFIHIFSTITTGSLGTFLALGISVFIFFLLKIVEVSPRKLQFTLVGTTLIISFTLLFSAQLSAVLNYSAQIPPSSTDSRIVIYEVTRQLLLENYFWGIGPGNFQAQYLARQDFNPPFPQWAVPHPHNNLLLMLLEGGFLAFLGFMLMLSTNWYQKKTSINALLFLLLSYFLIHGLVDTTIWKNDLAVIFWLFLFAATLYTPKSSII